MESQLKNEEVAHWIQGRLTRSLVFVHGKGGVGKTVVSKAIAQCLSDRGHRTLWVAFEDPTVSPGEFKQVGPHLAHLNCDFTLSFEEYAAMKIGAPRLARLFLQNRVIQYLAKAAPGIHELVLLGKVWFESSRYSHVVVDLPATGHGLTMFQSTENFARLFGGGPLTKDAEGMLESFRDARSTAHVIVALPEEMPLRESLDLNDYLKKAFPKNPASFLVNRLFPHISSKPESKTDSKNLKSESEAPTESPDSWPSPVPESASDYALKRLKLEEFNLRIWREENIPFGKLDFIPPPLEDTQAVIVKALAKQLHSKNYV